MQRYKLHDFQVEDLPDDGIMASFELEDETGKVFTVSVAGDSIATAADMIQALQGAAKHLRSLGETAIIPTITEQSQHVH